jgi:hypothetical protein
MRREFIALLRGVAIVYPLSSFAQQHAPLVQIRPVVVTPEEFRIAYPKVQAWIQKTLAAYEKDARPIASMHFARLPVYFDYDLLETVKFIPVDQVPMPPLSAMGLDRFAAFEQGNFHGVTYLDRYFIKRCEITGEQVFSNRPEIEAGKLLNTLHNVMGIGVQQRVRHLKDRRI